MKMTIESNNSGPETLSDYADKVAFRYSNESLANSHRTGLPLAWRGMLKDLRKFCPGFSEIEYGIALNQALHRH